MALSRLMNWAHFKISALRTRRVPDFSPLSIRLMIALTGPSVEWNPLPTDVKTLVVEPKRWHRTSNHIAPHPRKSILRADVLYYYATGISGIWKEDYEAHNDSKKHLQYSGTSPTPVLCAKCLDSVLLEAITLKSLHRDFSMLTFKERPRINTNSVINAPAVRRRR